MSDLSPLCEQKRTLQRPFFSVTLGTCLDSSCLLPKSSFSVMGSNESNPEDPDGAFAALFELFSKPIKSPQKAFRTYQLTFDNDEPVFTLGGADRILEKVFAEIFGAGTNE
jgi:hypothetical protein